jgi:hypothetical protein
VPLAYVDLRIDDNFRVGDEKQLCHDATLTGPQGLDHPIFRPR